MIVKIREIAQFTRATLGSSLVNLYLFHFHGVFWYLIFRLRGVVIAQMQQLIFLVEFVFKAALIHFKVSYLVAL